MCTVSALYSLLTIHYSLYKKKDYKLRNPFFMVTKHIEEAN